MKICLLSRSDSRGGAYAAAYRLHQGLQSSGVNTTMLVGQKTRDDSSIIPLNTNISLAARLDRLPILFYSKRQKTVYSTQWFPNNIISQIDKFSPDIINLHWVYRGFVQIEALAKFNKPIVWTLHDMAAFTGGCHYSQGCDRYIQECGSCPQLGSNNQCDLSHWNWQRKINSWKALKLVIVTPSQWLAEQAKLSSLFREVRVEVISNGLDIQIFTPHDKEQARKSLGLPHGKKILLFGAPDINDYRKGFHLLLPALEQLYIRLEQADELNDFEIVAFGTPPSNQIIDIRVKINYIGRIEEDESLALLFSAVDVFICPSNEDNLPNTIMESLACGTPCVAFDIGGIPDMIEHQKNGYLVSPFNTEELAHGILWVLENPTRYSRLSDNARVVVEKKFSLTSQSQNYQSLFEDILSS